MWLNVILKLVPFLVTLAEQLFINKPKSGTEKKAWVMGIAENAMNGIGAVSTGGQAETWAILKEPISLLTDAASKIIYHEHDVKYTGSDPYGQ